MNGVLYRCNECNFIFDMPVDIPYAEDVGLDELETFIYPSCPNCKKSNYDIGQECEVEGCHNFAELNYCEEHLAAIKRSCKELLKKYGDNVFYVMRDIFEYDNPLDLDIGEIYVEESR